MAEASGAVHDEVAALHRALATAAEAGAARARRAGAPILRGRWVAVAAGRIEQRERVAARLAHLGSRPPPGPEPVADGTADVAALLRADLGTSHALAARARRVARFVLALGDPETGRLLERVATESAGHAAELARALALHYTREARARAT
jgi:bacterioferritin (cytochrome b1)